MVKLSATGLLLVIALLPPGVQALTPNGVSAQIEQVGPQKTIEALYKSNVRWDRVIKGIVSGTTAWLTVAKRLLPAADAHPGEQLAIAVGEALEHRPGNVLRVFGLQADCSGPDIDDPRYDGYKRAIRAVNLRQRMLRDVHAPDLVDARERCISELEKSKAAIARFYGVKR